MPACTKCPYPTPAAALYALQSIKAKHPSRGEKGVHFCNVCRAFHLTSRPRADRNRWTSPARRNLT